MQQAQLRAAGWCCCFNRISRTGVFYWLHISPINPSCHALLPWLVQAALQELEEAVKQLVQQQGQAGHFL